MMNDEIGQMVDAIWHALNTHGEHSIPRLKKLVEGKALVCDWAIDWLAREDKIVITPKKRSFSVRFK